MSKNADLFTILVADDDSDDRLLIQEAFDEVQLSNPLEFVQDGVELLDYLYRRNGYSRLSGTALPGMILLDLNMPRMDGREAPEIIKGDSDLRRIPVIILTTSRAEEDILRSYDLGTNSFIAKPVTFEGLVGITKTLKNYWLQIVELPAH